MTSNQIRLTADERDAVAAFRRRNSGKNYPLRRRFVTLLLVVAGVAAAAASFTQGLGVTSTGQLIGMTAAAFLLGILLMLGAVLIAASLMYGIARAFDLDKRDTKQQNQKTQLGEHLNKHGWQRADNTIRIETPPRLAKRLGGSVPLASKTSPSGVVHHVETTLVQTSTDTNGEITRRYIHYRGIFAPISTDADVGDYVHIHAEPRRKDSSNDIDFESDEFNQKYRIEASSAVFAYRVLTPTTLALLLDTHKFPSSYAGDSGGEAQLPFEYYVDARSVFVYFYHADSLWTQKEKFIFADAQFQRFFSTLGLSIPSGPTGQAVGMA